MVVSKLQPTLVCQLHCWPVKCVNGSCHIPYMWRQLLQPAHMFSVPSFFQIGYDVPGAGRGRLSCRVLLLVVVSLGLIKFSALHLVLQLLLFSFSSLFLKKFALFVAHQKFMAVTCCQVTKIYGYLIKFNESSEAKELKVQEKGNGKGKGARKPE